MTISINDHDVFGTNEGNWKALGAEQGPLGGHADVVVEVDHETRTITLIAAGGTATSGNPPKRCDLTDALTNSTCAAYVGTRVI